MNNRIQHPELTDVRLWRFITEYTAEHGFPPNQREMAAAVHLSRAGVRYWLPYLVNLGVIRWTPNVSRGVVLLRPAEADDERAMTDLKALGNGLMTRAELKALLADCDNDTLAEIEVFIVCLSHGLPHELIPAEGDQ